MPPRGFVSICGISGFAGHAHEILGWRRAGLVQRENRPLRGSWTAFGASGEMELHFTAGDEDQ